MANDNGVLAVLQEVALTASLKAMALTLQLNGQERSFQTLQNDTTLTSIVAELGLKSDRIAIEVNGEIIPRTQWEQTSIKSADKLEVVHFVGGGSGR